MVDFRSNNLHVIKKKSRKLLKSVMETNCDKTLKLQFGQVMGCKNLELRTKTEQELSQT